VCAGEDAVHQWIANGHQTKRAVSPLSQLQGITFNKTVYLLREDDDDIKPQNYEFYATKPTRCILMF